VTFISRTVAAANRLITTNDTWSRRFGFDHQRNKSRKAQGRHT